MTIKDILAKLCSARQFETYERESVIKGNKPHKDGKKIWIDWFNGYVQFGVNTIELDEVSWFKYTKIKLRKGVRCIKPTEGIRYYIKLNIFERIVEYYKDNLTNIMAWIGGIISIILSLKEIFS